MRKFGLLGLALLVFFLGMAGGCSKKVSSTPAGTSAAGAAGPKATGLTAAELEAQRLAEMQRQAIDKIGADRIYFAFDKSDLTEESRRILTEKSDLLKANPGLSLLVEGHCDDRGSDEYNRALGENRALVVRDHLISLGIESSRVETISYGEEQPAVPNATSESQHARNRRAEFQVGTRQ